MPPARAVWDRYHGWVIAGVTAALALVCYGFVLRLPFFFDDLPIMTWLSRHDWVEIWTQSSENHFYRPLAFSIYKLGRLFPAGIDRALLHGVSLSLHWISAILVAKLVRLTGGSAEEGLVASVLFVVFPFLFLAVPWITAMSHPLVTALTLLATCAALEAEDRGVAAWWGLSLLATALAPLAHESGPVCAVIVGGVVLSVHGFRSRRRVFLLGLGVFLNGATVVLRSHIPGVGSPAFVGAQDWVENTMFFLHGLTYPVAPALGRLVRRYGVQDFALVGFAAACFFAALAWLLLRSDDRRWAVVGLWWWAWGALPAGLSLRYAYVYTAPRLYSLAAVGTVILWSKAILWVSGSPKKPVLRRAVAVAMVVLVTTQSVTFLRQQAALFSALNGIYQQILDVADGEGNAPLGFVNIPRALSHPDETYVMIQETVLFVPPYSNIGEFIEVNAEWVPATAVIFAPVLKETDLVVGLQGYGLDWDQLRWYALEHETIWLVRWDDGRFRLDHVGTVTAGGTALSQPLARFEGGPTIESAWVEPMDDGCWSLTLDWIADGPVDARIFVHVVDDVGNVVAQADGPALGGMLPPWAWRAGDRIRDVRRLTPGGCGPFTVRVGLSGSQGRLPAYRNGIRWPEDAANVARIHP